jgi:site-specific DNA recombinase
VQPWSLPEGSVISKYPAHAALVGEADFIAAQDTAAPPARPAVRRYLLARLLVCGRCGRRLEWPDRTAGPPTGAATDTPAPPSPIPLGRRNTYPREDQILPHLAALSTLSTDRGTPDRARQANIAAPAQTADLIDRLHATDTVLTYDPDTRTIHAGDVAGLQPRENRGGSVMPALHGRPKQAVAPAPAESQQQAPCRYLRE